VPSWAFPGPLSAISFAVPVSPCVASTWSRTSGHEDRCLAWLAARMLAETALPDWASGHLVVGVGGQTASDLMASCAPVRARAACVWYC
jgi:hypothetical protein